jgi:1-aminocyclopropane-1-carboxylate deaminase
MVFSSMQFSKFSHFFSEIKPSSIQRLDYPNPSGITVDIKRDDQLHPIVSGNKWRKLKYLMLSIESQGYSSVAAMGGPYSNFLHSLSYLCWLMGWECHLFIRGYSEQKLTHTLRDCIRWGAKITFVDRLTFREYRSKPPMVVLDTFWIAEGGLSQFAIKGMKEVFMEMEHHYDYIVTASATGTSVAGLSSAAVEYQPKARVLGVSVLKNAEQQRSDIRKLQQSDNGNWSILDGFEHAGFAKFDASHKAFVEQFYLEHKVPIEPIYSGKSIRAVFELMEQNYFPKNSNILLMHCGGLQGKME